jgi:hypothetical protein
MKTDLRTIVKEIVYKEKERDSEYLSIIRGPEMPEIFLQAPIIFWSFRQFQHFLSFSGIVTIFYHFKHFLDFFWHYLVIF